MDILKSLGIEPSLLAGQIIAFLIFAALFWKYAQKPLLNILDQRQADIQATYDQLDADRDAMVKTRREYEQRLANIEAEAREQIQAAVKEAQALREQMLADAHKQSEAILERSRVESQREREKAFTEMRQQIVSLSVAAAGKVIGEELDAKRHTKLVDDFIGLVASGSVAETGRPSGNGTSQRGTAAG
jgi:F-type H+-transporting ATPase subunit b